MWPDVCRMFKFLVASPVSAMQLALLQLPQLLSHFTCLRFACSICCAHEILERKTQHS